MSLWSKRTNLVHSIAASDSVP